MTTTKKPRKKSGSGGKTPYYRRVRGTGFKYQLIRYAKKALLIGLTSVTLFLGFLFYTLPNIDDLTKVTKAQSVLIKSEDGTIIGSFGDIYGEYITFSELPVSLIDAVIATEDRNFYHHFGVDPLGIARAMFANIKARRVVQGASTITQQVAKNVFLTPERKLIRKIKEMLLAFKLEYRFTKEEILTIYLNRVYFGAGSYGVDAASRRYFEKSARDLTLAESAIMAGLLKAPSRYSPTSNPTLARKRADQILVNMHDADYLNEAQTARARKELENSMKGKKPNSQSTFYFADWIADQLPEYVGNVEEDLEVTTTLRPDWQQMAEKSMHEVMDKNGEKMNASQASIVALSPDGAIRVMIGGLSYAESQYNRATQSERQAGSAFKLFVYLAGLEGGFTPESTLEDEPISIKIAGGTWRPQNYTHKYKGTMTIKEAVAESVNTIAVQVSEQVGRGKVINLAQRLGITADMQPVPSIALGATEVNLLELTNAYTHLAANGAIIYPYGITEIRTIRGKLLYKRQDPRNSMALSENIVAMMNEMLMGVVENGTGKGARIGRQVAGKTGTTSDYKDAWFIGYTPNLACGVWVGNDDNQPMKKVTGGSLPAQIWNGFMREALAKTPPSTLPTDRGLFSFLPWNNSAPSTSELPADRVSELPDDDTNPAAEPPPPTNDNNKNDSGKNDSGLNLGDSFWKKLEGAR